MIHPYIIGIYGGYARSCVAKTIEDNVENEYIVTDENGCATDPTIFGEWDYNADTQSLLAGFNAFKFPSSDNIRFQCNIRVCFGKCQPVRTILSVDKSDLLRFQPTVSVVSTSILSTETFSHLFCKHFSWNHTRV